MSCTYGLSDDGVIERWAQDVYFQFFSGQEYFEARFPCDKAAMLPIATVDVGHRPIALLA